MADEKNKPAEPQIQQPPEAKPYEVVHEMPTKPIVAPDGHVTLSKEDIKSRA